MIYCSRFMGQTHPSSPYSKANHTILIPLSSHKQTFPYMYHIMLCITYIYYMLVLLYIEGCIENYEVSYNSHYV